MNPVKDQLVFVWVVTLEGQIYVPPGRSTFHAHLNEWSAKHMAERLEKENAGVRFKTEKVMILANKVR